MVTVNVINTTTGIKKNSLLSSLSVYPNPVAENANISLVSAENTNLTYSLVDIVGNIVESQKIAVAKGENVIQINTSALSHGMYFIHLISDNANKASTLKIAK
jgi:hypothetical protein